MIDVRTAIDSYCQSNCRCTPENCCMKDAYKCEDFLMFLQLILNTDGPKNDEYVPGDDCEQDMPEARHATIKQGNNDAINRQTAIDALDDIATEISEGLGYQYEKWRKYFAELPAAESGTSNKEPDGDVFFRMSDVVRAVDKHTLEDGTLDDDITCILEEVTPHRLK